MTASERNHLSVCKIPETGVPSLCSNPHVSWAVYTCPNDVTTTTLCARGKWKSEEWGGEGTVKALHQKESFDSV